MALRAHSFYLKKDFASAASNYTLAIGVNPNDANYYTQRGSCQFERQKFDEAIPDLEKGAEMAPTDTTPLAMLAYIYATKKDSDGAIKSYTRLIALQPDSASHYFFRGTAYEAKADNPHSIEDYTKAIQIDASYAQAFARRGALHLKAGKKQAAAADLKKAIEIDPTLNTDYGPLLDRAK